MDLLLTYKNELLALVSIIVILLLYIIIKNKTSQTKSQAKEDMQNREREEKQILSAEATEKKEEELSKHEIKEETKQTETQETTPTLLDGKEEGDFGVTESDISEKEEGVRKKFVKKDVPPHEKITKDNFKEFAGKRILLAEDNIINQKVILGLLADSGIEVVVANDGAEALDILEKDDDFTLILMDAHMPRIDGFEATRAIRANPKYDHIVVVALSGDTAADDIKKMTEAGMSEQLEKPLKLDALYDVLYAYSDNQNSKAFSYTELDTEEGLEISGYDTDFYHEILKEFLQSYENAAIPVAKAINEGNYSHADKLLLDIIGVSANIGATKLTKTAMNLKSSIQNKAVDSQLYLEFKEDLKNLTQEIKNYLAS